MARKRAGTPDPAPTPAQRGPTVEDRLRGEIRDLETRLQSSNSTALEALKVEIAELRNQLAESAGHMVELKPEPQTPPPPIDPANPNNPESIGPQARPQKSGLGRLVL